MLALLLVLAPSPALAAEPALTAPEPFAATPIDRALKVSWGLPGGVPAGKVLMYEIRWRPAAADRWTTQWIGHRAHERVIGRLANHRAYDVGLRAVTLRGTTPWTASVRALPADPALPAGALPAPSAASAQAGNARVTLSWGLPPGIAHPAIKHYEVRWKPAATTAWAAETSLPAKVRQHAFTALANGSPHAFGVRAITDAGPTAWTADALATPTAPPAAPAALTTALAAQPGAVRVRWTAAAPAPGATPATGYELAYRVSGEKTTVRHTVGAALPADATEGTLTVPVGQKYTAYVRALGAAGAGRWREAVFVVPAFSLPVIRIGTAAEAPILTTEDYVAGDLALSPAPGGSPTDAVSGALEIKGRGNSTWTQPKKPYRLKLDKAAALLGMPKSKHWALLANYLDRSFVRNAVTFELGETTRLGWTPKSRAVEVVLNGRYLGLYQLTEQVRLDPARIAIDPLKPTDITGEALTGGYHLERDHRWKPAEEAGFRSGSGEPFALKDPEQPAPEQLGYIQGYVNETERALFGTGFKDPATGYAKYLDVDSFVDWYVVSEYVRANDAWYSSTNLVKPRSGKLAMGPLWDFDYSMGNRSSSIAMPPTGDWVRTQSRWFNRLMHDPAFVAKVKARWRQLRPTDAAQATSVDRQARLVETAAGFDRKVWSYGQRFDMEVGKVRSFLAARAAYLDREWNRD